jgi:hypothetical protein
MQIDDNDAANDFAAFEAQASTADTPPKDDERTNEGDDQRGEDDDQSANVNDQADGANDDDAGDDGGDEKGEKKRSKSPSERIAEVTKARREAERRAEAAEARLAALEAGKGEAKPEVAQRPNPADDKYEFGEADPKFIEDLIDWKADQKANERAAKDAEEAERNRAKAVGDELNARWQEQAEKATEEFPDFKETVIESADAKEWPLLPLSAAAVAQSEVGYRIAHHLATNKDDATKLARAEQDFHTARAAAIDAGLKPEIAMLMAKPHLNRLEELFDGLEAKAKGKAKPTGKIATDAPEPVKHQVRGSGGRFDVGADTSDFAAFERKANAKLAERR